MSPTNVVSISMHAVHGCVASFGRQATLSTGSSLSSGGRLSVHRRQCVQYQLERLRGEALCRRIVAHEHAIEDWTIEQISDDGRAHVIANQSARLRLADDAHRASRRGVDEALQQRGADDRVVLCVAEDRGEKATRSAPPTLRRCGASRGGWRGGDPRHLPAAARRTRPAPAARPPRSSRRSATIGRSSCAPRRRASRWHRSSGRRTPRRAAPRARRRGWRDAPARCAGGRAPRGHGARAGSGGRARGMWTIYDTPCPVTSPILERAPLRRHLFTLRCVS